MNNPASKAWALEGHQDVTFSKAKEVTAEIQRLIDAAARDRFLGDVVNQKDPKGLVVFRYGETPAGFAIPRRDSDGRYRTGPIFVLPQYRRKGVAQAFVKYYFADKKGRSYIEPDNHASQALFKGAGFAKSGKQLKDGDGVLLDEYLKD